MTKPKTDKLVEQARKISDRHRENIIAQIGRFERLNVDVDRPSRERRVGLRHRALRRTRGRGHRGNHRAKGCAPDRLRLGRKGRDQAVDVGARDGQGDVVTERPILFSGPLVRAILSGTKTKTETRRLVTPGTSEVAYSWDQLDWDAHVEPKRARLVHGQIETYPNPRGEPHTSRCEGRDYCSILVDGHPSEPAGFGHGEYIHVPGKVETRQRVFCRITPGDVLWVRESWRVRKGLDDVKPSDLADGETVFFDADGTVVGNTRPVRWGKGRPSIFLPKWASRIRLRVTEVRAERLQWITGAGVLAEGIDNGSSNPAMGARWENQQRMAFERLWDKINGKRTPWASNPWVWVIKFERQVSSD